MKKIVIIDDEYFFRQALIKYVRSFKDEFSVVGRRKRKAWYRAD